MFAAHAGSREVRASHPMTSGPARLGQKGLQMLCRPGQSKDVDNIAPRSIMSDTPPSKRIRRDASLTMEQLRVLAALREGRNVFATGPAGVGKSYLIKRALECAPNPAATYVTATTGVAAINIGGATLHSFAGIRDGRGTLAKLLGRARGDPAASARWRTCRLLIIDEISMLDADLLERIDGVARAIRNRPHSPFGGVQLLLTGDLLQLPPVGSRDPSCPPPLLAFQSPAWAALDLVTVPLTIVFRQRDPSFAAMLAEVRLGRCSAATLDALRARVGTCPAPGVVATRLRARRNEVDAINNRAFASLPGEVHTFRAMDEGPDVAQWPCPAPAVLHLRVGCAVLLLKNLDVAAGLSNGSQGVVVDFLDPDEGGYPLVTMWQLGKRSQIVTCLRHSRRHWEQHGR